MAENSGNDTLIKVLIVDDEQLVRRGLRMTVDWAKYHMTVVADAPNGSLGWEEFLKHRPQLVITDIVMPEMDGIELANKIKTKQPETKILFLSCHGDFRYAQKGIQIGISDYIVKTCFDDKQIDECLTKILNEIKLPVYSQSTKDNALSLWLTEGKPEAMAQLKYRLENEWKWMVSKGYVFQLYTNRGMKTIKEVLLNGFLQSLSTFGRNELLFLRSRDDSLLILCPYEEIVQCENELIQMKTGDSSIEWRKAGPITSPEQWMSIVHKLDRLLTIELQLTLRSDMHKEEILNAIDYIDQNLHIDLRVADIARKIGVSRSYFSTIFKESTGVGAISFITSRKLERAKQLLQVTTFRTDEIAEKVGISDVKYFSKWFKKNVALTPGQFRIQTK